MIDGERRVELTTVGLRHSSAEADPVSTVEPAAFEEDGFVHASTGTGPLTRGAHAAGSADQRVAASSRSDRVGSLTIPASSGTPSLSREGRPTATRHESYGALRRSSHADHAARRRRTVAGVERPDRP